VPLDSADCPVPCAVFPLPLEKGEGQGEGSIRLDLDSHLSIMIAALRLCLLGLIAIVYL